ncbi:glycoside hydrolase family 15 [Rarobacter incanus]|uniref:glycoside hydrolase family 15 n=1 Tax=Rarobacter incanus TaxID=153494 RepID=UPI0011532616|nr:glycoside hydrolase family 15 [Rarobacter incanus]
MKRSVGAADTRSPWRRGARAIGVAVVVSLLGTSCTPAAPTTAHIALISAGVRVEPDGTRTEIPAGETGAGASLEEILWLGEGTVPGAGTRYEALARRALLDLRALTVPVRLDDGTQAFAAVAGWDPKWRYVWPRDGAFAAVAFAQTGHLAQARGILRFLGSVQGDDGAFQARYLPDDSGRVPDARPQQYDAAGWAMWATAMVRAQIPAADVAAFDAETAPLLRRSVGYLLRTTVDGTRLPPASPDYWETRSHRVTLGTAASALMGLEAGADLGMVAPGVVARYREVVVAAFGSFGYPRDRGYLGSIGQTASDGATAFIAPPFVSSALPGATQARKDALAAMMRPAGGLAPGGSWRNDGISWTPSVGVNALSAAYNGDPAEAYAWIDWIGAHLTTVGSIPEKVLADGSPAAVAPLGWSDSLVLLTLIRLESATRDS